MMAEKVIKFYDDYLRSRVSECTHTAHTATHVTLIGQFDGEAASQKLHHAREEEETHNTIETGMVVASNNVGVAYTNKNTCQVGPCQELPKVLVRIIVKIL